MTFVRAILGDVDIEEIGITFSHEHIVIEDSYVSKHYPQFLLNDTNKTIDELLTIKALGCTMMVDTMPVNAGRNPKKLADISKKTGINILSTTGIHQEKYYPEAHWRYQYSAKQLAEIFIADIEQGIDEFDYNGPIVSRTKYKCGLLKLGTNDEPITKHQEKIFEAVVHAHLETGAPILTHTNAGKHALAQAEMFLKYGADLSHIVLSHVDKCKDLGYQKALFETGINVEYDSAFRWRANEENWTMRLLVEFLDKYPTQITVGMDAARSSYWRSYGGNPGLDYLLTTFVKNLNALGLGIYFNQIFINNPKRIFSFDKK